jgi:purine-binding chemotaxis protein CheW
MTTTANSDGQPATEYVTVTVGGHLFGLTISRVQDVFVPDRLTRVPLAPPEIAGILNLRGRVITSIDMRACLDFASSEPGTPAMAVGIEWRGESYGLLVDSVGEVIALRDSDCETKPVNLDSRLSRVADGVYRLEGRLLIVLDVDRVLDIRNGAVAA